MNLVDVLLALLVGGGAALGMSRGGLREAIRLAAWAAATGIPMLLAGRLAGSLQDVLETSFLAALAFSWTALALFAWLGTLLGLRALLLPRAKQQRGPPPVPGTFDRATGALLGAATTAAVAWAALSVAVIAESAANLAPGPWLKDSALHRMAGEQNAAAYLFRGRLNAMRQNLMRPAPAKADAEADALMKALSADAAVRSALEAGDIRALFASPIAASLLSGSEAMPRSDAPPPPPPPPARRKPAKTSPEPYIRVVR